MDELANFIVSFWVNLIEVGRFEMPFKGNDKLTNIANVIRFTQVAEDKKVFSDEQIEELKKRMRAIVERQLLKGDRLYTYTHFSCPMGYLEELFKGIEVPRERFPFETCTMLFHNSFDYEEALDASRCGGEEAKVRIMKEEHPGGGVFCTRDSGDYWHIIAVIQP